jgi:Ferric iron reductase FhuF-like transporter
VVTAVRHENAAFAPIVSMLAAVRVRHGDKALAGIVPELVLDGAAEPPAGWLPATALLDRDGVTHLLDAAKQRWSAQPHAAAALAWKSYTYWLALPTVLGYAAARRVPLVTPDNVLVHYAGHQPFLRVALRRPEVAVLAGDPIADLADGVHVVPDEPALLAVLRDTLVDRHLVPVMDGIRDLVNVGRRTLWGSVGSAVSYALARAAGTLPEPARETAAALLSSFDAADLVDLAAQPDGGLAVRRRTCCLAFTLPEPKICSGCCIRG